MSANCLCANLQSSLYTQSQVHPGWSDSLVDNTSELKPGRLVQFILGQSFVFRTPSSVPDPGVKQRRLSQRVAFFMGHTGAWLRVSDTRVHDWEWVTHGCMTESEWHTGACLRVSDTRVHDWECVTHGCMTESEWHTGASRKFLITHPRERWVTDSVGQFVQTLGTGQDTEEDEYMYTSKKNSFPKFWRSSSPSNCYHLVYSGVVIVSDHWYE